MSLTNELSPADITALAGNGGGMNNEWWIILLFLFAFGGFGNGFGGGSVQDQYVLASDFATLQRQISDSTNSTERKLDSITNGICELGYTEAQLINNVNMNMNTQGYETRNAITQAQIAGIQNANTINSSINSGFCSTNFNAQNNTRDIIEAQNANTNAILEALNAQKTEALKEKIAEQAQTINALQLSASQSAQNAYLINQLKTAPVPAYTVPNPYTGCCYSGCNC